MFNLSKLEKKLGKYAINNLIIYVLAAYGIGYILQLFNSSMYSMLALDPGLIFEGQVWRIFTWICTVPTDLGIFTIFMFLLYYWIGTTLEHYWGTFRYNVYMISGYLFITLGSIIIYGCTGLVFGFDGAIAISGSTYYINMASFLAFASLFPDHQIYFMMIIPLKMKYLAIIDLVLIGYEFLSYISQIGKADAIADFYSISLGRAYSFILSNPITIVLSLLNFIIFFFVFRKKKNRYFNNQTRRNYKKETVKLKGITKHKCAVCGRSEEDDEDLVFRFCSKCDGNYEYCQDHLFTHEHIKKK